VAGLAASQIRRMRRIVDAAVRLAEQGGFDGVRLRDVAEASDVALGTLYKYFRSKEDILLFALAEDMERLEASVTARPILGDTRLDRVVAFFARATTGLTRRPQFARAVLRSISAGDSDMAVKVAGFMLRMTRLIAAAQRGEAPNLSAPVDAPAGTEREQQIAFVLTHFWFSSLSGWAGGLHTARTVSDQLRIAAALLIEEE
jgi:AcrR family transcriptional regulator